MWQNLFKLRASVRFKASLSSFLLESIGVPACPIFFQYVVDRTFHILIKQHHQLYTFLSVEHSELDRNYALSVCDWLYSM